MAKKKKKSLKVVEPKKRKRKSKPTQLSSFVGSKKKRSQRPERKQLKAIFKLVINPMIEARVNALITIVKWYDAAIDWVREDERKSIKLQTIQKQRILDSIDGIRQMSLNTNNISQREELLKKLIGKFEEALKGIYRTKSLASTYGKLAKVKRRLEKQSERITAKYSRVIDILQDALKPKNAQGQSVQFKVGDMTDGAGNIKERTVSIDFRSLLYAKSYAQKMLTIFKQDGLLPLALKEIPWLARIGAHKPNEEEKGKFIIDIHKEIETIFELLNNLTDYCRANPKIGRRLVKIKRKARKKK